MRRLPLVLLLGALPAAAQEAARPVQREIASAEGRTAVVLDADVYEHAREDLGDLRIVDERGAVTPYLLDRSPLEDPAFVPRRPEIRNRGFVRGRHATATLDFGGPVSKDALTLRLPGDNFRRRVMVEARSGGDQWTTLVDDAWVFAVPEPRAARYETVPLPPNDAQVVRVTVFGGEGDPERLSVDDAWIAAPSERRRAGGTWRPLTALRSEDGTRHETMLVFDLGARHQPYLGLRLKASSPRFFRGVVLEQAGPPGRDDRNAWSAVRDDVIYRMPPVVDERPMVAAIAGEAPQALTAGSAHDKLTIAARGRARRLRLRILNRDDAPLDLSGFEVEVPEERVVFDAQAGHTYALAYGRPELSAPQYDLARTVGDAHAWGATARETSLRAPVPLATPPPPARPWTERHPALLWTGLVMVVGALGLVTWRALARAG